MLAQRLVRKLCPQCRTPVALTADEAELLRRNDLAGMPLHRAVGCVCCAGVGHRGRTGLFELLPVDERLATAIRAGGDEAELRRLAAQAGRGSLRDDALAKLRTGQTSFGEVMEALAD